MTRGRREDAAGSSRTKALNRYMTVVAMEESTSWRASQQSQQEHSGEGEDDDVKQMELADKVCYKTSFASSRSIFSVRPSPGCQMRLVDGSSNAVNAACYCGFAPVVPSRDSDIGAAGSNPDVGGGSRLLAVLECPGGSVVSCVNGVLASVGAAQTCEEACDGEYCFGPGAPRFGLCRR